MQHRATGQVEHSENLGVGILVRLLRRPLFLAAGVIEVTGLGLQTLALGLGALAVVQPLLVLGLLLAVPLSAFVDRRPLAHLEVAGAILTVVGLGGFLTAARPSEGTASVDVSRALVVTGPLFAVALSCCLLALRRRSHRAILLAMASGVLYGISSGLIKAVAHSFGDIGFAVVLHWQLWALLAVGVPGLVLTQHAFAAGGLGAPLAVLTLTEPVSAVIVGRFVLDERLAGGVGRISIEVFSAMIAAVGVWLLAAQPSAQARGVHPEAEIAVPSSN